MDNRLVFILNRARHRINKFINKKLLGEFGISSVQAAAILFLETNKDSLQKELSIGLDMNNSAATTLVERLIKNDFIKKDKSTKDRRAYLLNLTEKGKKTAKAIKPFIKNLNKIFEQEFSKEELEIIIKFLNFSIEKFS